MFFMVIRNKDFWFHGLHVLVGTAFLIISVLSSSYSIKFFKDNHWEKWL